MDTVGGTPFPADTARPTRVRWLVHGRAPGSWNMAVDDVLHRQVGATGLPVLRWYGWNVPTLSLGYFQAAVERAAHAESRSCPMVRRGTGGGAIVHHLEVTYSLAVPEDSDPSRPARRTGQANHLYEVVHTAIQQVLSEQGISMELWSDRPSADKFLCFQRRSPGDGVVRQQKVLGSAQRRRHHAMLQHGSLLLQRSPAAPELPGLQELTGRALDADELVSAVSQTVAHRLNWQLFQDVLTADEHAEIQRREANRYLSDSWNLRR